MHGQVVISSQADSKPLPHLGDLFEGLRRLHLVIGVAINAFPQHVVHKREALLEGFGSLGRSDMGNMVSEHLTTGAVPVASGFFKRCCCSNISLEEKHKNNTTYFQKKLFLQTSQTCFCPEDMTQFHVHGRPLSGKVKKRTKTQATGACQRIARFLQRVAS